MKKSTSTVSILVYSFGTLLTRTEVLEIEKGASKIEIKKAYHKVREQQQRKGDPILTWTGCASTPSRQGRRR